jgi:predicted nucleic acid-binding protein
LFAPASAFEEAREHLPAILSKREVSIVEGLAVLDSLALIVKAVHQDIFADFEAIARHRLARRDPDDWPVLAAALALRCPIWTEGADFFGAGVATWTTDRVEMFFREAGGL